MLCSKKIMHQLKKKDLVKLYWDSDTELLFIIHFYMQLFFYCGLKFMLVAGVSLSVTSCFKLSQPQRITSGLKETFTKR